MKVVAIIPAAGLGTRMAFAPASKGQKPSASKQFLELSGVPVLVRALQRFASHREVAEIIVALRKNEIAPFQERLKAQAPEILKRKAVFVEGGESRQQSVSNSLAAVTAAAEDIILVHDAVRPFVTDEIISEVIAAAHKYGAAITGIPAVDTVKQVERTSEGAVIRATIPREKIVLAQTPQGFRYSVLKKAFDEAAADGFIGTDEASMIERSGQEVWVVMGSARNIKITTPSDLELAEHFLRMADEKK
jgi:2-C-methyl-D-erythritol 4-phosphate cytidylyltransferase